MIYIVSNDIYLQSAIQELLYPILVKSLTINEEGLDRIKKCNSLDTLLIDITLPQGPVSQLQGCLNKSKVVFLSDTRRNKTNTQCWGARFYILNNNIPLPAYRKALIDIITLKDTQSDADENYFTRMEDRILEASLKGNSAAKIARMYNMSVACVYTHRLRACQKLGVRKISDVLPFLVYFKVYRDRVISVRAKEERKIGLSGVAQQHYFRATPS